MDSPRDRSMSRDRSEEMERNVVTKEEQSIVANNKTDSYDIVDSRR